VTAVGDDPGDDSDAVRVDPHVKLLDERVVARAKRRGLDVLVYAPHFTRLPAIRERARRFSDDDLLVVPGREVFTGGWRDRKHLLAVGLSEPVPDFITLAGAVEELLRQEAAVLVPHPGFLTVSLDRDDLRTYRDAVDAVEVYDPKLRGRDVDRARALAGEFDLPPFGASYAHLRGSVGEVWTAFDRPIPDEDALVAAFRERADRRVFHRSGRAHRRRRYAEFAHLFYENTVKKFDRVVLSGTEPTHPSHPAYGGRFDDVACDRAGVPDPTVDRDRG
jgi:predicted metal-dependent phosphoesterase TrpH